MPPSDVSSLDERHKHYSLESTPSLPTQPSVLTMPSVPVMMASESTMTMPATPTQGGATLMSHIGSGGEEQVQPLQRLLVGCFLLFIFLF